jgi:hypothetical protein
MCPFSLSFELGNKGAKLPSHFMMLQLNTGMIIALAMADLAVAQQYGAMELGQGMSPRYFFDSAQPVKRQSGNCQTGYHNCKLAFNSYCMKANASTSRPGYQAA